MRRIGPYDPAATPSVTQVVAASTPTYRNAIRHLLPVLISAEAGLRAAIPRTEGLKPAGLTETDRLAMMAAYKGRSADVKRMFNGMRATLPTEHADLCPFCSMDSNPQLDHFLPQTTYPELCLTPLNLIPICSVCNGRKSDGILSEDGERLFVHPQHDPFASTQCLVARVSFDPVVRVSFHLAKPTTLDDGDFGVAQRQFVRLQLAHRFARRASGHLDALANDLRRQKAKEPAILSAVGDGFRDALRTEPPNGWRRATMIALHAEALRFVEWLKDAERSRA